MSDNMPLLTAKGFTVSYGTVDAVQGIDVEIGEGETVALLGANGAGKTSTLRALSRLIRSSGEVMVGSKDRPPIIGQPIAS